MKDGSIVEPIPWIVADQLCITICEEAEQN